MCSGVQADSVEDLTALNALYRPGPIQGGMIDDFIERKLGRRKVEYALPELEGILKETLELSFTRAVMQISKPAGELLTGRGGLTAAFNGKKNAEAMAEQRDPLYGRRSAAAIQRRQRATSST